MQEYSNLSLFTTEDEKLCDTCKLPMYRGSRFPCKWKKVRFCSARCKSEGHSAYFAERRQSYLEAGEKTCTRCGEVKPLSSFRKGYGHADSLQSACNECLRKELREAYWRDPVSARAYARTAALRDPDFHNKRRSQWQRWYARNRESQLDKYRAYNEQRREQQREYDRERRAAWTPERRRAIYKAQYLQRRESGSLARWQHRNKTRIKEYNELWRKLCRRKNADKAQRRRAQILKATVEDVNRGDVIEKWGKVCYICDKRLSEDEIQMDHVIPISRGGKHSESNLRPCCQRCNLSKGNKLPSELDGVNPSMAKRVREQVI